MISKKPRVLSSSFLNILAWLTIAISCISINQWSEVPIGNTTTTWILCFLYLLVIRVYITRHKGLFWSSDYKCCAIFLCWAFINSIRGAFIAENYWEYKQLVTGVLMCSLPLFVYIFQSPQIDAFILRKWNKWMLLLFIVFFIWVCNPSCYFFLLPFFLLYACFWLDLPTKWKCVVFIMIILFCLGLDTRSNIIKVATSVCVAIGMHFRFYITRFMLRLFHWAMYGLPLVFLALAYWGNFNVLSDVSSSNEGKMTTASADGTENVASDTRSFIYYEVLEYALEKGYTIWGNTPARGNYSYTFFVKNKNTFENMNGKNERHANELVHLNIFTWLGIIGVVLYSLIYMRSSYMAVYHSKSLYIKMIGVTVAFHWAFGWIEDFNSFTVQNMWLWMMIAMGLSPQFREMNDQQFREWFKSIFRQSKKMGCIQE